LAPRLIRPLAILAIACSAWALDDGIVPDARLIDRVRHDHGAAASQRVKDWGELLRRLPQMEEMARLDRVNRFFNRIPQGDDMSLWGERDYWASPLELLAKNGGDCEDFALAKYFSLKSSGIAVEKLRITYVRAWIQKEKRMEAHMVLAYYSTPDAEPLILDNLSPDILPAGDRSDLTPTHSFNADGLWSARQRGQSGRMGDASSVKRWVELLERMNKERN
jgi:predicted transglutaminase-like cysteine proteinase